MVWYTRYVNPVSSWTISFTLPCNQIRMWRKSFRSICKLYWCNKLRKRNVHRFVPLPFNLASKKLLMFSLKSPMMIKLNFFSRASLIIWSSFRARSFFWGMFFEGGIWILYDFYSIKTFKVQVSGNNSTFVRLYFLYVFLYFFREH